MDIRRGTIIGFSGSWHSGFAFLEIDDEDEGAVTIPAESGPLGRALGGAFDAIGEGHTIDVSKIQGQEIYYSVASYGILEGFTPVDEAPLEIIEAYEAEREEE